MTRIKKSRLITALMTIVMVLSVMFGVAFLREQKSTVTAKAEESINVTQVQFRTSGDSGFFFLRMSGQTDYATANQWHDHSTLTCNVLDKVTVYFLHGAYSLREVWRGDAYGTYTFGDDHTLSFPMKADFYANQGVGAKIDAGAEIPMLDGTCKTTQTSRSFWNNGTNENLVIDNYAEGFQTIETTLSKLHIRGGEGDIHLMIGLGAGNDWDGKGEAICTEAKGEDGTNDYAINNWMKLYLTNFTSKIKLHVKETNTWVNYGSIIRRDAGAQWAFVYNGWGEAGGIIRLKIDNSYNGTTVDKVLFEEGCELPSYEFNGKPIAHTVHVLDKAYLLESNDMSTANWAVNWTVADACKVTFNGANDTYVKKGETVAFPTALSETKPDDENGSYVYNWFLNGEIYDFTAPVTENIDLTSDGSFTTVERLYALTYLNEDGTQYAVERYTEDTAFTLLAVPKKVGYDGVWKTSEGENPPTVMPNSDLTLQVEYTKNFYVRQVQFRTHPDGRAMFFLRFNTSDYTQANQPQAASFVENTNLLDKVTVYFDDGEYSLREIWDSETVMTYLWGDDNTLCFMLKEGFVANCGRGARIDAGAEIPMIGSIVTTDTARKFWTYAEEDRSTDFGIDYYEETYQVTFNGANAVYVAPNGTVAYPTDISESKPNTAEYTYVYNWFLNGEIYDFSTPITASIDLVSDGSYTEIPNEYKVTYYALDGALVLYEDVVAYGELLTLRAAESVQGYADCAWIYNEDGAVPATMPAKDISFTLQGTAKTYILSVGNETVTVTYAQAIGDLPAVPEQAGYSGVWTANGETLTADYVWMIDGDMTAEIKYTANTYTLTFSADGVTVETRTVTYGEGIGELPQVPEKEHYIGVWALADEALNADMVWSYTSDLRADARYTFKEYTVTFDGANATQYKYAGKIERPADPTKEPTEACIYTFDGWYNGDVKWDFDTHTVEGDLNLVARYTQTPRIYTVTFVVEGHTLTMDAIEVAYGGTLDLTELLTEEQVAGYTYSMTVNGVEKANIAVYSDVTVNVTFTVKADAPAGTDDSVSDNNGGLLSKFGCSGVVGSLSAVIATLTLAGVALMGKRKEN